MHDPHSNAPARKCRDQLAEPFPPITSIWGWIADLVQAISRFWLPALSSRTTATAAKGDGDDDDAAAAAAVARDKGHLDQNSTGRYRDALLLSQIHHIIPLSNSLEQSTVTPNPATQPNLVISKNSPAQRSSGLLQCRFRSTVRAHWRFLRSSLPRLRNCPHIPSVICPSSLDGNSLPSAATVAATRCCKLHAVRCHASCAPHIEPLPRAKKRLRRRPHSSAFLQARLSREFI